jgi:hypothetical protein
MGGPHHERRKPSMRAIFTNMHVPMPLWKKLWLVARNGARRIVLLQNCCGHPGEPGC